MLRCKEMMRKLGLLATLAIAPVFSASNAFSQSDDGDSAEKTEAKSGFTNPFSKLFAKKTDEESSESPKLRLPSLTKPGGLGQRTAARKQPAEIENKTESRGGLLVPLKSFTNRVLSGSDERRDPDFEQALPSPATDEAAPTRPVLEPFQNNRRPLLRNRASDENTLEVETYLGPSAPASPTANKQETNVVREPFSPPPASRAIESSSESIAPIVRRDFSSPGTKPATNSVNAAPIGSGLHTQSTSRRSNSEHPSSGTFVRPAQEASKANDGPSLLDLSMEDSPTAARVAKPSTSNLPMATTSTPELESKLPRSVPTADFNSENPRATTRNVSMTKEVPADLDLPTLPPPTSLPSASHEASMVKAPIAIPKPTNAPAEAPSARKTLDISGPNGSSHTGSGIASLGKMQLPGVQVSVQGPNSLLVGQPSMFEVLAKNEGSLDLNGLIMRLTVPPTIAIENIHTADGVAQPEKSAEENAIVWELEKIPAGGHKSLRITLQTQKPEHFAMGVEWTAVPQSQEYSIHVQQPQLEVVLEGPSEAEFGTPQNYRLRVKNPGNATAKGVEVTLTAATFGSNKSVLGDVQPGAERIVDVELLFEQDGTIPVSAVALSSASNLEAKGAIDVRVKKSHLEATWSGPNMFYQGSTAEYSLVITNNGDAAANHTDMLITLPHSATPVQLPAGAMKKGNQIQWEIKRLLPNESISFPIHLTLNQTGENKIELQSSNKNGVSLKSQFSTNVDSIVDLQLTVKDPPAPAPVGQNVYYDIEVFNRGKKVASNVEILVQFSDGVEPTRAEGHEARIVPGQVIFAQIPQLAPGAKIPLRVAAEAAKAGIHRFRVEVKSDSGEADVLQEKSTRYMATTNSKSSQ